MNKLFTKIVGTCLGLAMAVGTGVAVASSREAMPVYAASWSTVTSVANGDVVVIGASGYEMTGVSSYGTVSSVTNNTPSGTYKLTVETGTVSGFAFKDSSGKYVGYTGSSNSLTLVDSNDASSNWTIGTYSNKLQMKLGTTQRYMSFNSSANPKRIAAYGNNNQNALVIYKYSATKVTSITLNKNATTLSVGDTETLSVSSVLPNDADDKTYSWSSTDGSVASVSNGVVTANAVGTATIKATANDGSGVHGDCVVTVQSATAPKITVSGDSSVYVGGSLSLTATPENFAPASYTWSSTNTNVATVSGTSTTGTITPLAKGETTITATAKNGNDDVVSNTFVLTVKKFSISSDVASISSKASKATTVTITPTDAAGTVTVTAVSSNNSVATTSVDGLVVTITTGEYGGVDTNVTITASDGAHSSNEIIIPVSVEAGYRVGSKVTSLPESDLLVYIVADKEGTPKYMTSAINKYSTNDSEAALFYLSNTGTIKLKDSNPAQYVYCTGSNTTVSSSATAAQWSNVLGDENYSGDYPGLLQLSGGRFLHVQDSDIKAYASSNLGSKVNFYAYEAIATVPTVEAPTSATNTAGVTDTTSYKLTISNFTATGITVSYKDSDESEFGNLSDIAEVSSLFATGDNVLTIRFKAAGTTTAKIVVSGSPSGDIEKLVEITVLPVPTTVNVKVAGEVVDSEYVLSRIIGGYKQPSVEILPEGSSQEYTLTVQSETVDGAFTIDGKKINYVKVATGVIRVASVAKPSIYFDLNVEGTPDIVTALKAEVAKDFYVGDTISKSDITLTATYEVAKDQVIDSGDYTFADYEFKYFDAPTGGSTLDTKSFEISFGGQTCELEVNVGRKEYSVAETTVLSYNGTDFYANGNGIAKGNSSSYAENQTVTIGGIEYGVSGYIYNTNISISSSSTSAPGHVKNNTAYSRGISDVSVTGASPDIQYSVDGNTWVDKTSATVNTVNYLYFKVFFKNTTQTNYVNISNLSITLKGEETARTLADYVMYEDTTNQCTSKYDVAEAIFIGLSTSEKSSFMTGTSHVISTARARFEAWAAHEGKTIEYVDGSYVINQSNLKIALGLIGNDGSSVVSIIVIISLVGLTAIGGYFFFRKRKED